MSTIDISGLTSPYTEYATQTASQANADKLKKVAQSDYTNSTDDELMGACKEFESYFLEQVFKEMWKTVGKEESSDQPTSNLLEFFKDSTIQELASQSTEKDSLGLAQMLYEQMKRNIEG